MEIAIIGAGTVGTALATAWSRAGHSILLGLRDAGKHGEVIERTGARALSPADAAQGAEVVVLALPYPAVEPVVWELGPLAGKVLIDTTNPVARTDHGPDLALGFTDSAAEALARLVPQARVVKTLNQVGAEIMLDTSGFAHPPVMFMAGDDEDAKRVVSTLLADLGFEPLDAGPLHRARLLEALAMVWINQALRGTAAIGPSQPCLKGNPDFWAREPAAGSSTQRLLSAKGLVTSLPDCFTSEPSGMAAAARLRVLSRARRPSLPAATLRPAGHGRTSRRRRG